MSASNLTLENLSGNERMVLVPFVRFIPYNQQPVTLYLDPDDPSTPVQCHPFGTPVYVTSFTFAKQFGSNAQNLTFLYRGREVVDKSAEFIADGILAKPADIGIGDIIIIGKVIDRHQLEKL